MAYTIQQLANLAGVSVRTLHYYDQIGLLAPAGVRKNSYRYYETEELLKLQQILFYRELEFSLVEIKRILSAPDFDMIKAFRDHRKLIKLKKDRLDRLIKTIDKTINKLNKKNNMEDQQLYSDFSQKEIDEYAQEAKERWGNTKAYKKSQARVSQMTKADMAAIKKAGDELMKKIAALINRDPKDEAVQKLIAEHYDALRKFYEPSLPIYSGLADMYISDQRFTAYYEKYATGLAQFMHEAMKDFISKSKQKSA